MISVLGGSLECSAQGNTEYLIGAARPLPNLPSHPPITQKNPSGTSSGQVLLFICTLPSTAWLLFNKQLFYKLINEYYPEYNPTGYNKGPFKYDKYEYVKKLYEKNPNIAKTLCFRLLNDNILDLGFDLIERISKYYTLGSSIASLYTGLGEPVYFENILKNSFFQFVGSPFLI